MTTKFKLFGKPFADFREASIKSSLSPNQQSKITQTLQGFKPFGL